MIHPSQIKITAPSRPHGGQKVGVSLPCVVVEHVPSGCKVTVKGARSQKRCKDAALDGLEMILLGVGYRKEDLEVDTSEE